VISYRDGSNSDLKVAHCDDVACTSATLNTVDSTGSVGTYTSIAIGADGLPFISYYDITNHNLKAAHCNDVSCSSATLNTVESSADRVGQQTSVAIGKDGLPVISYLNFTRGYLRVAHCDDVSCSSATFNNLDTTCYEPLHNSIAIGADGLPVISYWKWDGENLKIAHCNDVSCSSAIAKNVYTNGYVGKHSSIAIGADGLPVISFRRTSSINPALMVAHCASTFCTPHFRW
jgi:hypothetical protein